MRKGGDFGVRDPELLRSPRISSPNPKIRYKWSELESDDIRNNQRSPMKVNSSVAESMSQLEHQLRTKELACQKLSSEIQTFLRQASLQFHCRFETLGQAMEVIAAKQSEYARSTSDLKQTQIEKESLQRELTKQRDTETSHRQSVASLNREIVEKYSEIEALTRSVKQLQINCKAEHIRKQQQVETTMSELEALRAENEKLSATLATAQDQSMKLLQLLEGKSAQVEELQAKVEENKVQLATVTEQLALRNEEVAQLKEMEIKTRTEMASVEQKLADSEKTVVALSEKMKAQDNDLTAQVLDLKRQLQDADKVSQDLRAQVARRDEVVTAKEQAIAEVMSKLKQAEEQLAKSEAEASQVKAKQQSEVQLLEQKLQNAHVRIGSLSERLDQKDADAGRAEQVDTAEQKKVLQAPEPAIPTSNEAMSENIRELKATVNAEGTAEKGQAAEGRSNKNVVVALQQFEEVFTQQSDELDRLCQQRATLMTTLGKVEQLLLASESLPTKNDSAPGVQRDVDRSPVPHGALDVQRETPKNQKRLSPADQKARGVQCSPQKRVADKECECAMPGHDDSKQFAKAVFDAVQGLNISSGKEYAAIVSNLIHTGMLMQQQAQRIQERGVEQPADDEVTETHIPTSDSNGGLTALTDSAMSDQMEYLWEENKDLVAEIERLEQSAADKEQEWSGLVSSKEKKIRALRHKIERMESTIQQLQSDVVACHQTIESQEQRIEQERSTNDSLKQRLDETVSVARLRKHQLRSAEDDKAEVIKGIRLRSEDIQARYDKVIAKLEDELTQAKEACQRMSDELSEAQSVKNTLAMEKAKLYATETALRMKVDSLSSALERSQEEYQMHKSEMHSTLQDTIDAKDKEIGKYKAVIDGIVSRFSTTPLKSADLNEACAIINTGIDRIVKQRQMETEQKWKSSQALAASVRHSFY